MYYKLLQTAPVPNTTGKEDHKKEEIVCIKGDLKDHFHSSDSLKCILLTKPYSQQLSQKHIKEGMWDIPVWFLCGVEKRLNESYWFVVRLLGLYINVVSRREDPGGGIKTNFLTT